MAKKHIDRAALIAAVRELKELSNEQKADILQLISEQKKYGLVWEDSPEEAEDVLRTNIPVLKEVKDKAILSPLQLEGPGEAPNHILIEGENLQALNALVYLLEGMVDVIYIDPPYNTGNKDFVYNDSFVDTEDGYRHSKWLSFIEKRLRIAKKLLSDKGVIFISIDDNEQANLKLLCDEVLNGMDFIATIPWRKRTAKSDVPHSFSQDYEWIMCYSKQNFLAGIKKDSRKYYETPDFPERPWRVHDLTKQTTAEERPKSFFTIVNPKNGKQYPANPNATWRITVDTFEDYYKNNRIVFPGDYDFLRISKPVLRYWKEDDESKAGELFGFSSVSSDLPKEIGMTQDGTKDLDAIFGHKVFGFPKPMSLIKYLLQISTPLANDITILDFFAGSGTTLHATMQLNAEDGGHRQCILVTNNENNICEEVTYERNKRVIEGYTTPKGVKVEGLHNNNLRYYKMDFVPRENTAPNRMALMEAATDMLCIKEGCYTELRNLGKLELRKKYVRYFAESKTEDGKAQGKPVRQAQGKQMLIVYEPEAVQYIAKELREDNTIATREHPLHIFVYSDGGYAYQDEFEGLLDVVELTAMPDALMQSLRNVLPEQNIDDETFDTEEGGQDND